MIQMYNFNSLVHVKYFSFALTHVTLQLYVSLIFVIMLLKEKNIALFFLFLQEGKCHVGVFVTYICRLVSVESFKLFITVLNQIECQRMS